MVGTLTPVHAEAGHEHERTFREAAVEATVERCLRGRLVRAVLESRWHLRRREKGGAQVGMTRQGMATESMAVADCHGLAIAVGMASGERHDAKLVVDALRARFVKPLPERLIGVKACDSDPLDAELAVMRRAPAMAEVQARGRHSRCRVTMAPRPEGEMTAQSMACCSAGSAREV